MSVIFSHLCINEQKISTVSQGSVSIEQEVSDSTNKQLLDEVFVISRIIEVEVGVFSRSRRLRLITLTETSIILNITKTESNNCFIIHCTEKISHFFASSLTPRSIKRANLT